MKKYFLLILLAFFGSGSYSQSVKTYTLIDNPLIQLKGDSVHIDFTISAYGLSSDYRLDLTPVLFNDTCETGLPSARISGRRNLISESRRRMSNAKSIASFGGISASAGEKLHYRAMIPYAEWMNGGSLRVDVFMQGCCQKLMLPPKEVVRDLALVKPVVVDESALVADPPVAPEPILSKAEKLVKEETFIRPQENFEVDCKETNFFLDPNALRLFFRQAKDDVDISYNDNFATLRRLRNALETIMADSVLRVSKILIVGYASIEGTADFNHKLAGRRAQKLVDISKSHGIRTDQIHVINMGEGWDELRYMVEHSTEVPNRDEVLKLIDSVPVKQYREKRIMELNNGVPYRWMLKHLFPYQRNTGYFKIYYERKQ